MAKVEGESNITRKIYSSPKPADTVPSIKGTQKALDQIKGFAGRDVFKNGPTPAETKKVLDEIKGFTRV